MIDRRYTFGDVQGALRDATAVRIGVERDTVTVRFTYHDTATDKWYEVVATGTRREVTPKAVPGETAKEAR